MKTKWIFLFSFLFLTNLNAEVSQSTFSEGEIKETFSRIFSKSKFSITNFTPNTGAKSFSGSGTFLGKKNISFSGKYNSAKEVVNIHLIFPEKAKVKIKSKSITNFAGASLYDYIPSNLVKSIFLDSLEIQVSKKDKAINQLNLGFKSNASWTPLSNGGLKVEKPRVGFNIKSPTAKEKRKIVGLLKGNINIGGKIFPVFGDVYKDKKKLKLTSLIPQLSLNDGLSAVSGATGMNGISVPNNLWNLTLKESTLVFWPNKKSATIDAQSNWGKVHAWMFKSKKTDKKLQYTVSLSPPAGFKLSNINAMLKSLDAVDLAKKKIVFSSAKVSKEKAKEDSYLSKLKTGFDKGCHMVSTLDLTKLKLDHFLKVKELVVSSPIGAKLNQVKLESNIEQNIPLGPNATFSNILFQLSPAPKNFALSLIGSMKTKFGSDELLFKGGMELILSTQTMNFRSTLEGNWKNPLGTKGLIMTDVGLQIGGSFGGATILPNIAVAGKLKVGRFSGAAAVALDTRRPDRSMISANIEKLYMGDIVNALISKQISNKFPKALNTALNGIRLNKLYLEVVPTNMTVLGKDYKAGFRAGGNIDLFGLNGFADLDISYTSGVFAQGGIDPIDLGIFKLKGANGNAKPSLLVNLKAKQSPKVAVNGAVSLLGITAETEIKAENNGVAFMVGGKIFNLFQGKINAKASNLKKLETIYVKVQMQQDLLGFIQNDARKKVEQGIGGAISKLTAAQNKIKGAEAKVAGIDRNIASTRKQVVKDQAGDRAKLLKAETDVNVAKGKVNSLQTKINNLEKSKKGKNALQVLGINAQIKTLQASKITANGVLTGYQKTLNFVRTKVRIDPDLDPRILTLKSSKGVALASLKTAHGSLEVLKKTLGVTGTVASFAMEHGPNAIINVKKASFEGTLGSISKTNVNMSVQVEWLKQSHTFKMAFNFNDPKKMVQALTKKLLAMQ